MLGPYINSTALVAGGLLGPALGKIVPRRVKEALPMTCGILAVGIGTLLIQKVHAFPAVALALLAGALIGEILFLERGLEIGVHWIRARITRLFPKKPDTPVNDNFVVKYVTILVLFCASGMGIFGATHEGMTGDPNILLAKSVLDLFTAMIFATDLGLSIAVVALPQLIIQGGLFLGARLLIPMTTPEMLADFSACGGIVLLATGLRICGIKVFPIVNMLPALLLILPASAAWTLFFA